MYRIIGINSDLKLIHFIAYLFIFFFSFVPFHLAVHLELLRLKMPCHGLVLPVEMIASTPKQFMWNSLISINIMYRMLIRWKKGGRESVCMKIDANINSLLMLSTCRKLCDMDLQCVIACSCWNHRIINSVDEYNWSTHTHMCMATSTWAAAWKLLSRKCASLSSGLFNHKSLKQISFSANTINIYEFELRFIVVLQSSHTLQVHIVFEVDWRLNMHCKWFKPTVYRIIFIDWISFSTNCHSIS